MDSWSPSFSKVTRFLSGAWLARAQAAPAAEEEAAPAEEAATEAPAEEAPASSGPRKIDAIDRDFARSRSIEPRDQGQQRRLAAA